MTVLSTYTKLQSMVSQSTGVTIAAPTALPATLNSVHLPCCLCFPGAAEWVAQTADMKRQNRPYTLRIYVKPVAQGQGLDEGYQAVLPILQAVGTKFLSSSGLSLENTVDHITNIRDTGVGVLTYGGIDYHGCEFTLTIVEKG